MTDGQTEVQRSIEGHSRYVYMASQYCPCFEQWVFKMPFLCRKDAVAQCEHEMRLAVREGRPLEYWHVDKYQLPQESEIVWGCCHTHHLDDQGSPDCV